MKLSIHAGFKALCELLRAVKIIRLALIAPGENAETSTSARPHAAPILAP
ncbi:hypothetical protein LJR074_003443 [Acidovorax sp. LjRoot74]